MNEMLKAARAKGVFIIHAPSTCTGFYKDTPQRKLAKEAPFAKTPVPLADDASAGARPGTGPTASARACCRSTTPTWAATARRSARSARRGRGRPRRSRSPRATPITDDGQETWNLLAERKIDNVILCGVHLNMCVLGRPFAIRQMVKLGKNVALIRDMTDTMYNPERPPGVSHFDGHRPRGRTRRALLVPELREHRHHRQAGVPLRGRQVAMNGSSRTGRGNARITLHRPPGDRRSELGEGAAPRGHHRK